MNVNDGGEGSENNVNRNDGDNIVGEIMVEEDRVNLNVIPEDRAVDGGIDSTNESPEIEIPTPSLNQLCNYRLKNH